MSLKKCKCECNNKVTCPNCSKIKMVILLKYDCKHLKLVGYNGRLINPVWYSHLSKNNKPKDKIIDPMIARFKKCLTYNNSVNKIMFYDNQTKDLIREITL